MIIISKMPLQELIPDLNTMLEYMNECFTMNAEQADNHNFALAGGLDDHLKQGKLNQEEYVEQLEQSKTLLYERLVSGMALEQQITRLHAIKKNAAVICLTMSPDLNNTEVKCYLEIILSQKKETLDQEEYLFLTIMQQTLEGVRNQLNNCMVGNPVNFPILPTEKPFATQLSSLFEISFIKYINEIAKDKEGGDATKIVLIDRLLERFDFLKQIQAEHQGDSFLSRQEKMLLDNLCCLLFYTTQKQIKQLAEPQAEVNRLMAIHKKELSACCNDVEQYGLSRPGSSQFNQYMEQICGCFDITTSASFDHTVFMAKTSKDSISIFSSSVKSLSTEILADVLSLKNN